MGLLSAFKRTSSREGSNTGLQRQSDIRPASSDENAGPTPLRPLKLSLTPAKPRSSSDISDGLQGRSMVSLIALHWTYKLAFPLFPRHPSIPPIFLPS